MGIAEISFFSDGTDFVCPDEGAASEIITLILREETVGMDEINVIFCGDTEIRRINNEFLNKDRTTDVISFTLDGQPLISEIYIGIEQVKKNSRYFNETFENEINRVLIHGVLHLCGYKDYAPEEKEEMRKRENYYLDKMK